MNVVAISYIIPYYRLEQHLLNRAIRSILELNKHPQTEIIVIDDGTPDSKAQTWLSAFEDNRIHYFYQENGGLSDARNSGIRLAKNAYVQFVDADDYLLPPYRHCFDILKNSSPDILLFQFQTTNRIEAISPRHYQLTTFSYDSGCDYLLQNNLFAGACNYIFKRSLLSDGLRFIKGIYHEDEDFTPRLLMKGGKTVATNLPAYAYYQRNGSITNNQNKEKIAKRLADLNFVLRRMKKWRDTTAGKEHQAIARRFDQLSLNVVYETLRNAGDWKMAGDEINELSQIGSWPLAKLQYSYRYRLFCLLTDKIWKLKLMRILLKKK